MTIKQLAKLAAELSLGDITHELGNLSQLKYDPRQSLTANLDANLVAAGDRAGRRKDDVEEANALRAAYAEMARRRAAGPFLSRQKMAEEPSPLGPNPLAAPRSAPATMAAVKPRTWSPTDTEKFQSTILDLQSPSRPNLVGTAAPALKTLDDWIAQRGEPGTHLARWAHGNDDYWYSNTPRAQESIASFRHGYPTTTGPYDASAAKVLREVVGPGRLPPIRTRDEVGDSFYRSTPFATHISLSTKPYAGSNYAGWNPLSTLTHEYEHHRQNPGIRGIFRSGEYSEIDPAKELAASLGGLPTIARQHEYATGKPLDEQIHFPSGYAPTAEWLGRQAANHGMFRGRSVTESLATPSGLSWLDQLLPTGRPRDDTPRPAAQPVTTPPGMENDPATQRGLQFLRRGVNPSAASPSRSHFFNLQKGAQSSDDVPSIPAPHVGIVSEVGDDLPTSAVAKTLQHTLTPLTAATRVPVEHEVFRSSKQLQQFFGEYPNQAPKLREQLHGLAARKQLIDKIQSAGTPAMSLEPALQSDLVRSVGSRQWPFTLIYDNAPTETGGQLGEGIRLGTRPTPEFPVPPTAVAGHEFEHHRQFNSIVDHTPQGLATTIAAAEIPPSLADVVRLTKAYQTTTGRPLDYRWQYPSGYSQDVNWMTGQAANHGLFEGRTMTELLARPSGMQYLQQIMGMPKIQSQPQRHPFLNWPPQAPRPGGLLSFFPQQKQSDFAPGLPRKKNYGDLSQLQPGELLTFLRQRHDALRAGLHTDVRIGDKARGLFSWAVPRDIPEPGGRALAIQTPVHRFGYKDFEGTIPKNVYGGGEVRKTEEGQVLVTKVGPDGIHFTLASRQPERFLLTPTFSGETRKRNWLLINTTPTRMPEGVEKKRYTVLPADQVEDALKNLQPGASAQAKIDGSSALVSLAKDGIELTSYRESARRPGAPIFHTERFFGSRPAPTNLPPELQGSLLKGELYGADQSGRAIPAHELSGILNANIGRSLELQKEKGVQLRNMLFDIVRRGNDTSVQDLPYAERLKILGEILPHLPEGKFHLPETATTPEAATELWNQIKSKQYPLSEEGAVIWPETGTPSKAKIRPESDVHVVDTFPGEGKYRGRGVGGFVYSLEPGGEPVGRVGAGLDDETRRQAMERPEDFIGRVARIAAQSQFESGAHRAPSLLSLHALHEDLPLAKQAEEPSQLGPNPLTEYDSLTTRMLPLLTPPAASSVRIKQPKLTSSDPQVFRPASPQALELEKTLGPLAESSRPDLGGTLQQPTQQLKSFFRTQPETGVRDMFGYLHGNDARVGLLRRMQQRGYNPEQFDNSLRSMFVRQVGSARLPPTIIGDRVPTEQSIYNPPRPGREAMLGIGTVPTTALPVPPYGAAGHEYEHHLQGDTGKGFSASGRAAEEVPPSLADIVRMSQAYQETAKQPVSHQLQFPSGYSPNVDWMARQAAKHKFFEEGGPTMTELLAKPSGQAYLQSLMGTTPKDVNVPAPRSPGALPNPEPLPVSPSQSPSRSHFFNLQKQSDFVLHEAIPMAKQAEDSLLTNVWNKGRNLWSATKGVLGSDPEYINKAKGLGKAQISSAIADPAATQQYRAMNDIGLQPGEHSIRPPTWSDRTRGYLARTFSHPNPEQPSVGYGLFGAPAAAVQLGTGVNLANPKPMDPLWMAAAGLGGSRIGAAENAAAHAAPAGKGLAAGPFNASLRKLRPEITAFKQLGPAETTAQRTQGFMRHRWNNFGELPWEAEVGARVIPDIPLDEMNLPAGLQLGNPTERGMRSVGAQLATEPGIGGVARGTQLGTRVGTGPETLRHELYHAYSSAAADSPSLKMPWLARTSGSMIGNERPFVSTMGQIGQEIGAHAAEARTVPGQAAEALRFLYSPRTRRTYLPKFYEQSPAAANLYRYGPYAVPAAGAAGVGTGVGLYNWAKSPPVETVVPLEKGGSFTDRLARNAAWGQSVLEKQAGPVQDILRKLLQTAGRPAVQTAAGGLGGLGLSRLEQAAFGQDISPEGRFQMDVGNTLMGALHGNPAFRRMAYTKPMKPVAGMVYDPTIRRPAFLRTLAAPAMLTAPGVLPALTDRTKRFVNVLGSDKTRQAVDSAADMVAQGKDYFEKAKPLADKVTAWAADPKFVEHAWESGTEIGKRVAGPVGVLAGGSALGGLLGRLAAGGVGSAVAADDERLPYEARRKRERVRGLLNTLGLFGGSAGGSYLAYKNAPAILQGMGLAEKQAGPGQAIAQLLRKAVPAAWSAAKNTARYSARLPAEQAVFSGGVGQIGKNLANLAVRPRYPVIDARWPMLGTAMRAGSGAATLASAGIGLHGLSKYPAQGAEAAAGAVGITDPATLQGIHDRATVAGPKLLQHTFTDPTAAGDFQRDVLRQVAVPQVRFDMGNVRREHPAGMGFVDTLRSATPLGAVTTGLIRALSSAKPPDIPSALATAAARQGKRQQIPNMVNSPLLQDYQNIFGLSADNLPNQLASLSPASGE